MNTTDNEHMIRFDSWCKDNKQLSNDVLVVEVEKRSDRPRPDDTVLNVSPDELLATFVVGGKRFSMWLSPDAVVGDVASAVLWEASFRERALAQGHPSSDKAIFRDPVPLPWHGSTSHYRETNCSEMSDDEWRVKLQTIAF